MLDDVGRKRRFHTEPQRIAMAIRDRGCTTEGCDAHDPRITTTRLGTGKLRFARRT